MTITLTETPTKGTALVVPEDGVDKLKGITVQTPFQAAANRLKRLEDHVDTLEVDSPRLASNHFSYSPAKSRTVFVPLWAFGGPGWSFIGTHWLSTAANAILSGDLTPWIPAGASVANVQSIYRANATDVTPASSMRHVVDRLAFATVGNVGTVVSPWSVSSTTGTVLSISGDDAFTQYVDIAPGAVGATLNAIDTKANALRLQVIASAGGALGDIFYGAKLSLTGDTYVSNY